jgi:predicted transcriptional regulator
MTQRKPDQRVNPLPRWLSAFSLGDVPMADTMIEARRRALASWLLDSHDTRRARFRSLTFFDPSSDVLLRAFVAEARGGCISVSDLMATCDLPRSTALRYVSFLVEGGVLVTATEQSDDSFLELTAGARSTLETWLDEIDQAFPLSTRHGS